MNKNTPVIVSVVIPSHNRPQLVSQAVNSALSQTLQEIEVIVILDGPNQDTIKELEQIVDPRLRAIELPENGGVANARNIGIREAKGTWIAFLDDDDEWFPDKLKLQLKLANNSKLNCPVIATRFIARTAKGELIWPRRLPQPSEILSEYFFIRTSLFNGEAMIATPTIFTKKALLEQIPFDRKLTRHEDLDWLLRVSAMEGVGIEFVPEPMAIVNMIDLHNAGRKSLSNINKWQYSLNWLRSIDHLFTPTAYSGFIITVISSQASSQGDWRAFFPLLSEAIRLGKPRLIDYLFYLVVWLFPQSLRQEIRQKFSGKQQ